MSMTEPATDTGARGTRTGPVRRRDHSGVLPWLAAPALVFFVGFAVIPLVGVFALSFTTWDGIGAIVPSGLDSWRAVLADSGLPHALWVTFLVMVASWAVQTPSSVLLGTFLAGYQRYRAALSVVYFVPLLLSSAAIAIAYKALLDPAPDWGSSSSARTGSAGRRWRSPSSCSSWPGSSSRSTR
jgi:raffinose/stachyose/melibiose transport system permease protein